MALLTALWLFAIGGSISVVPRPPWSLRAGFMRGSLVLTWSPQAGPWLPRINQGPSSWGTRAPNTGPLLAVFRPRPIWQRRFVRVSWTFAIGPGELFLPLQYVAVASLVFPAASFVARRRGRRPGVCTTCGYDLHGVTARVCPECGAAREPGERAA